MKVVRVMMMTITPSSTRAPYLDIGSGEGEVASKLGEYFGTVVATETSPAMVKRCAESHKDWTVLETGTIEDVWEKFKMQNAREEEEGTSTKSEAAKKKARTFRRRRRNRDDRTPTSRTRRRRRRQIRLHRDVQRPRPMRPSLHHALARPKSSNRKRDSSSSPSSSRSARS